MLDALPIALAGAPITPSLTKGPLSFCIIAIFALVVGSGPPNQTPYLDRADRSVTKASGFPLAVDPNLVGTYPSETKSGGGYFYDDVLEYRVWYYPEGGGDDRYVAFAQYEQAKAFSKSKKSAEVPLVLVRQREWIDEPDPGHFIPKSGERITEWRVRWLKDSKRTANSIAEFIKHRSRARN